MTPNLNTLSSPVAVRPPMYHFSVPKTSLNPSEELSEPLRILSDDWKPLLELIYPLPGLEPGSAPGEVERGEEEVDLGECS